MELPLCHYPGTKNFDIAPNLLKKKSCVPLVSFLCVHSLMRIILKPDNW